MPRDERLITTPLREFRSRAFFLSDPATTAIYTLSLHDALPILVSPTESPPIATPDQADMSRMRCSPSRRSPSCVPPWRDRKSTRLNSSHVEISYAVFCLKKKKNTTTSPTHDDTNTRYPPETHTK